jgi:hypothetical protein
VAFLARVLCASISAGVVLGLAGRLAMRVIALESGLTGAFSLWGSLDVVAFGALLGGPAALAFFALRHRLRTRARWPGALVGMLLLGGLVVFRPPSATSALAGTPDTPTVTLLGFTVVFTGWGVILEVLHRLVIERRRVPVAESVAP